MASGALRGESGRAISWSVSARVPLIGTVVSVVRAAHFISPLYRYEEGAPLLSGYFVDLTAVTDDASRLTFLLQKTSAADLVVNRFEGATVAAGVGGTNRLEATGRYLANDGAGLTEGGYVVLAAGNSNVVTVCFREGRLRELLAGTGYPFVDKRQGRHNLHVNSG